MSPRLTITIGALIAGLMLPAAAEAAPARTVTDLNLRTGPGVGYGRITVIPGGGWVEVLGSSGGWCHVEWAGYGGWASCRYLAAAAPPPRYAYPRPDIGLYFGFGLRPWIFEFDRDRHYRPHYRVPRYDRPPRYDRVPRYPREGDYRSEERPLFFPRRERPSDWHDDHGSSLP